MATCFQPQINEDDSVVLFSTSNSPEDSTSYSSSFHNTSPQNSKPLSSRLIVRNLSYTIKPSRSIPYSFNKLMQKALPKDILKSVSFHAGSTELLALNGPSGAGKSSLLRIIAGRVNDKCFSPKTIAIKGLWMSGPYQLRKICGFVAQEDDLLPLLTVQETLMYSANFRLKNMSAKEREERVEHLMEELGLMHVSGSFVGDEENRGISGGERKRVSIGVDIIHDPSILVLDEPTSGLDSTSALQVVEMLSSMAKEKDRIIVLSIHQPSYRILQYISNFLILSRGSVVHFGSIDSLEETISRLGHEIPMQINALEYAMEIIGTLENSDSRQLAGVCNNEMCCCPLWPEVEIDSTDGDKVGSKFVLKNTVNASEIAYLCSRFWKVLYRTKQLFLARIMQALVGGFGLASVYIKVRKDEGGVPERLGLFAFSLSFLLSSTVESLPIYLQERRVLMKEASRGAYKISSYMIANTIIFMPFLFAVAILFAVPLYWIVGLNPSIAAFTFFTFVVWLILLMASSLVLFLSAASPDFISGYSLICTVLGAFFLFSGYFIPKQNIPRYWMFMYYVSLYRYPLDSLLTNEYWNLKGKCFSWYQDHSVCLLTGNDVLKGRGLDKDSRWMNVGIMFGFFVFYRLLSWIVLLRKVSKTTI